MTDRENEEYKIDEWTTYICDNLKAHCDFYDRSETYRMVDTIDYDDHAEAERLVRPGAHEAANDIHWRRAVPVCRLNFF